MAISPLAIATRGYLNSPLSVSANGYLVIEVSTPKTGSGGSPGARRKIYRLLGETPEQIRQRILAEDDEIITIIIQHTVGFFE